MLDRLEVGYVVQHTKIGNVATLAVARAYADNKKQIVKTFTYGEATAVYDKLTGVSSEKIMEDRLTIGAVFPDGGDMYILSVGRVVKGTVNLVTLFEGADAVEVYTLLTAVEEKEDAKNDIR